MVRGKDWRTRKFGKGKYEEGAKTLGWKKVKDEAKP